MNSDYKPSAENTAYCSNFGHFAFLAPPPLGGLGTTFDVHSWAYWKVSSGLPISVN